MTVDHELFADRLPTYLTRFVGRQRELAELEQLSVGSSMLTLCGVGGLGKTRLAVELARTLRSGTSSSRRFDDVFWVPLATVTDSDAVPEAVAAGLGLPASGPRAALTTANALRSKRTLIVLDNCEQVAAGCRDLVTRLFQEGLDLLVLATSRIAVEAPREHVYAVPPMGADAIDLFIDRATTVAPAYALTAHNTEPISEICAGLAGLPLAIELTASWVRAMSPRDLLDQLAEATRLVSTGDLVAERHRDLGAVLEGSWGWLGEADQVVATALGVFRGGFTRDAAERVAGASLASLAALTDRALIQRLPDAVGGSRYQMHELIRTHAVQRLREGDSTVAHAVRGRHFDYFLRIAEAIDTPDHTLIDPTLDSPVAREQPNLDAALEWAIERGDGERALRITDALDAFWPYSRPRTTERIAHLRRALALPRPRPTPAGDVARAKALNRLGYIMVDIDHEEARAHFEAAAGLLTGIDAPAGLANLANAFRGLFWCRVLVGDTEAAMRKHRRALALARAIGDEPGVAWSRFSEGIQLSRLGDFPSALAAFDDSYARFERQRVYFGLYRVEIGLAEAHRCQHHWREAVAACAGAFDLASRHGFTVEGGDLLESLSLVAAGLGRDEDAARLAGAATMWRAVYDERPRTAWLLDRTDLHRARRRLGEATWTAAHDEGDRLTPKVALGLSHELVQSLATELAERPADLTEREVDVLRLVTEGLNNTAIAERLVLSPRTVHAHLRSIFIKLGVTTRTAAAHEATRLHVV